MTILPTLFSPSLYLQLPQGILGWLGWLVLFGVILALLWRWRAYNKLGVGRKRAKLSSPAVLTLSGLFILTLLTNLFIGIRLAFGSELPMQGVPVDSPESIITLFSAVPWMLAAGWFGPVAAAALAFIGGLIQGTWETQSAFTPLEFTLLAVLFSAAVNQRYRTWAFRLLRHPLAISLALALISPLIRVFGALLANSSDLLTQIDFTLSHLEASSLVVAIELLVGGLLAELAARAWPSRWGRDVPLELSPAESSLQARFLYSMAPLALVLVIALVAGSWYVAENAASELLEERMASAARVAAENIPYFLETGQSLATQLASDPALLQASPDELPSLLAENIKRVPFFRQLYILDEHGELLAGYPDSAYGDGRAPTGEQMGVQLALNGVPYQTLTLRPQEGERTAQVSFIASIQDENGVVQGVFLGRSDLASNPFTQPILVSLRDAVGEGGQGILVDENGYILYHPEPERVMTSYIGQTSNQPIFYEDTSPDGSSQLVYYQPAVGRPWGIVLMMPAEHVQALALRIAGPMLFMIGVLFTLSVVVLRIGIRVVTASLKQLATEASRISRGELDHQMVLDGEDEVGQLRQAFEQMRISLKARLDELNQLLQVSQGVASSLEMEEAVQPVLASALAAGASSARVVLAPAVVPEIDGIYSAPASYGLGAGSERYTYLDDQILAFTRQQERLVLANSLRPRLLNFNSQAARPASLAAIALRHENLYYGTLWVAYDQPHKFTEEEVRFLSMLAGQAALAAANAHLFLNAEVGRQRLAAILASSPDPILVTDQRDRLLLANPAAWHLLGLGVRAEEGQPIDQVINQKELVDLLSSSGSEKQSVEVTLPGEKIYLATASSVLAEGQRVGRVCVLRDVTHFKELDALKTEFVSTVSHDLRSPLTLMRGYATMLEMVGQLNEQQTSYVRKIVGGVETMSRLVNNLLDLGRIDAGIGLQLEIVPVRDILERVVSAMQVQANQKHIDLTLEVDDETAPLVEADQALLQQALHNLVENAVKYTRNEGKVQVCVHSQQDRIICQVRDTGIGISPMDQPRLFEKFYRGAQQGSKDQRGSGLGLAIVRSIAERHGGQVLVESQLGKGSTFTLSIPLRQTKG